MDARGSSSRASEHAYAGMDSVNTSAMAPFLTNVESHYGRVTLTAPANIRRRGGREHRGAARSNRSTTEAQVSVRPRTSMPALRASAAAVPAETSLRDYAQASQHRSSRGRAFTGQRRRRRTRPVPVDTASTRAWDRRVSVWDEVDLLNMADLDLIEPPPSFSTVVEERQRPAIPNSPPPPFESDSDNEPVVPDVEPTERPFNLATMREQDAWERDRLAGFSLEERVARMSRRKAGLDTRGSSYEPSPANIEGGSSQAGTVADAAHATASGSNAETSEYVKHVPPVVDSHGSRSEESVHSHSTARVNDRRTTFPAHPFAPPGTSSLWTVQPYAPVSQDLQRAADRPPPAPLAVPRAPAPLWRVPSTTVEESSDHSESSSASDIVEDKEDSDEEWRKEHDALRALYRYEADMRRVYGDSQMKATRNVREATSGSSIPGERPVTTPASSSESAPTTGHVSSDEQAPPPLSRPAPDAGGTSESVSKPQPPIPLSLRPGMSSDSTANGTPRRALPPPPPSRVPFVRSAYEQLLALQTIQPSGEATAESTQPNDIATLQAYLSRYEPTTDAAMLRRSLSRFGGAFTNPRSSAAPLPSHRHLPQITDETRHFPPTSHALGESTPEQPVRRSRRRAAPPPPPPRDQVVQPPPRRVENSSSNALHSVADAAQRPMREVPIAVADVDSQQGSTRRRVPPPVPQRPSCERSDDSRAVSTSAARLGPVAVPAEPVAPRVQQRAELRVSATNAAPNPTRVANASEREARETHTEPVAAMPSTSQALAEPPTSRAANLRTDLPAASRTGPTDAMLIDQTITHDLPPSNGELTDLDVAVSQLDDPAMRYEWATLLTEFLGPAQALTGLTASELQSIPVARVELERRRVSAAGKVKQKLSVTGVRVDRCGICLQQFREGQLACIFPCVHM